MEFFTKNESGEFIAASDSQIEDLFKERSDKIVSKKLASVREKELERLRPELEKQIREETTSKLKEELKTEIEGEYKTKLEEATKAQDELNIQLRRKTIAAEYGFKPETEEFLGNGTEDEMRAKADTLKNSFGNPAVNYPDKSPGEPNSESLEKYGLDVKI